MSQPWDISIAANSGGPVRLAGKATGEPSGGSQPITREQFVENTTVAPDVGVFMNWTKSLGDDLVELTDPLAPTIITAGVYALTGILVLSAAVAGDGTFLKLDIELDADNDDADAINVAPLHDDSVSEIGNACSAAVTYYCPAGAVLKAQALHDITGGVIVTFRARLQRLS